jgi:nucleoid-associated protein YgaU
VAAILAAAGLGGLAFELHQARTEIATSQADQADLQSRLDQATRQLDATKIELTGGLGPAAAKALSDERDRLRDLAANAEAARAMAAQELKQTLAQLADIQAQLAAARPAAEAATRLAAERDSLKEQVAAQLTSVKNLQAQADSQKAEIDRLNDKLAAPPPLPPDVAALAQQLAETKNELNTALDSFRSQQADHDRLKQDLAAAAAGLAEAKSAAESRAAVLAADEQDLLTLRAQTVEAAGELANVREQLRVTQAASAAAIAENQDMKARLALARTPTEPNSSNPVAVTFVLPESPVPAPEIKPAVPVDEPPPLAPAGGTPVPGVSAPRVHVVAAGDTLSGLAKRYYGSAPRWSDIFEANRDVIKNKDHLLVGTALRIP